MPHIPNHLASNPLAVPLRDLLELVLSSHIENTDLDPWEYEEMKEEAIRNAVDALRRTKDTE